ncbi:TadE/TadG family type IV pilus assembly protein [Brevibacillus fluminis]|uniref:TadE/TadG family type IV pilus assembly protein n=1 Tax=Brevibacillus fluminis TaxID=511487 RepID=UPI003F8C4663
MKRWRVWREETGSQLVEFVLVFPLIWVLLIFAMDQFTIMYNKQVALAAAFEAGRTASLQPNAGLARYYAGLRADDELEQAIGLKSSDVEVIVNRRWRKGEHLEARVSMTFSLLASNRPYQIDESYFMMVENAEE